jgi:hypothetical protein
LERKNNQLRFSHQTIQEYAVARLFAESNVSLSDFVLKHQDTIFKRPTVWAVLNYLRDNTVEKYSMEVDRILENKPRSHVRSLLVDFMCRQPNPTEHEISTIGGLLRDDELALRILIGINNSPAWFKAFKQSHLPTIMSDPRTEQWPVVAVLSSAWRFEWDSTLRLVKHHEFDGMTLHVVEHCGNWTEKVVSLIERIATRVKQNDGHNYRIEGIVTVMSVDAPKDAARLAARLISTPTTKQPESKNRHNSPLEQTEGWYDLEEVAKAAPVDFLSEITPWLVSTAEEYHIGYGDRF